MRLPRGWDLRAPSTAPSEPTTAPPCAATPYSRPNAHGSARGARNEVDVGRADVPRRLRGNKRSGRASPTRTARASPAVSHPAATAGPRPSMRPRPPTRTSTTLRRPARKRTSTRAQCSCARRHAGAARHALAPGPARPSCRATLSQRRAPPTRDASTMTRAMGGSVRKFCRSTDCACGRAGRCQRAAGLRSGPHRDERLRALLSGHARREPNVRGEGLRSAISACQRARSAHVKAARRRAPPE
jgi:hypothetical protein